MQKINHKIEEDNFRKIIKEKLEGYSLPAGDEVWNKIENNLDKERKKKRRIALWSWISGTAAAAAVALFALALHLVSDKQINDETTYETTNSVSKYAQTIDKNVPVETVNQPVTAPSGKPERIFVTRKTKGEYAEVSVSPEIDVIKGEQENAHAEPIDHREQAVYPNPDPFGDDSPQMVKKSPKRKSINLSLGSGSNSMAMNTNANTDLMPNNVIGVFRSSFYADASESRTQEQLRTEDFPEAIHRAPLSFGLTVKKELNRTFSLETGLVYTFLESRFENRNWERKALLQLHYLGIPLNIQAKVWGDKQSDWTVYLSAGGMIEKGIYSHYKQTNYGNENYVTSIVSNEKIDGLQYSVSFAPGVDYRIYRNYSVYLEPKISYYFDNDQPVSARTEHPVVIGVNAGIRLSW
ncbi:hypothetical protein FACS1894145_2970 [Bacteroidia bacterium]|nr:hypothetical protein FACS1894145_2970 [Bacteroidia bacterium]